MLINDSSAPVSKLPHPLPLLTSSRLRLLGFVVAGAVVLALVSLTFMQYQQALKHAHQRHELLARVLEDHTTRSLDAVALSMSGMADLVASGEPSTNSALSRAMQQTLINLLQLRSLVLVDDQGHVLMAAGEPLTGRVDLAALSPLPETGRPVLSRPLHGRGLPRLGSAEPSPPGLTVLPFVQRVSRPTGGPVFLVALLNPDSFANAQVQTLNDARLAAALVRFDGQCVAATQSTAIVAGETLSRLPPAVRDGLERGRASWVGEAINPGQRVASFRALRAYPLWVLVEEEHVALVEQTLLDISGVAAGTLTLGFVVILLTVYASRAQAAREDAQQALQHTQSRLAERGRELDGLFASVQELIFRTDAAGLVQFINAPWQNITGRPVSDVIGSPLEDLFQVSSRPAVRAMMQAPSATALPVRERHVLVHAETQRVTRVDVTVVPLVDADRLVGYAGSAVDVTDLVNSQAQLREQLAFNTAMIESSPLPVVVRDTRNRYVRVNRAYETFTGRSRERIIGSFASLSHPPEHIRVHDAKDRELLARGHGEIRYEGKIYRADGKLREIYVTKSLITDDDGRPIAILAAFMDISEIREAERTTRLARDAAEAASVAKTEFIANVSHELRTPLQAILGFSELGARKAEAQARLASMFGEIHRAGQRMLSLVNDLLDLSKLDRKGLELQTQHQDIRQIMGEVVAELSVLAESRSVKLVLSLGEEPLMALVDEARLGQVIRNLVANAIRFSPPLSSVDLAAERLADGAQTFIDLSVSDRGPGVPVDELESIFEAFVQSSTTKDGSGGTGLGLTISRRIIEAHGGQLKAANREGGGAVFTVRVLQSAPQIPAAQPLEDMSAAS